MSADAPIEPGMPPPSRTTASGSMLLVAFGVFFGAILIGLLAWVFILEKPETLRKQGSSRLPVRGEAPDFHLTDQAGRTIDRAMMNGKVWLASFIFTRCGGTCPIMSRNTAGLQKAVKEAGFGGEVRFISFTVDPDWDTQEVLGRYAEANGADPGMWSFVRGSYEEVQRIAREGFKLAVLQGDETSTEPIIHSQSLVLMDRRGRIRGHYDGTNASEILDALDDIKKLLAEKEGRP